MSFQKNRMVTIDSIHFLQFMQQLWQAVTDPRIKAICTVCWSIVPFVPQRNSRRDSHIGHQEKFIDKFLITDEQAYIALALTYGKLRTRSCYFNPVGGFNKNNSLVELLDTSVLDDLASEQAEQEDH